MMSSSDSVTLLVRADRAGKAISPHLVGAFFEDLNFAADGGIYAELVQNRSFEFSATENRDWGPLAFWQLETRGGGAGAMNVGEVRPLHRNNPHYVVLIVETAGEGVGLSNGGFDGIPLRAGEAYRASFWAYQTFMDEMWSENNGIAGRPMPVSLRLESASGEVLASADLQVAGRDWTQYSATLTPSQTTENARLVLLAHAKGGLALDMVSLFPSCTFRGRPNGLRADLANAIADLKPKFVRFPGGCLVHGSGTHHYYNWKNTIGPVETRKAARNLWGYHQTMGLGYFEYFQFCEDIGALPLPVVSAGVCCQHAGDSPHMGQEGLPLDEMPAYIQDVLDLIEWANGPTDSAWGTKRAQAGHAAPFGLKYLGVGNEDAITPIFKERFRLIAEAVRAKYPEIQIVGTSGPFESGEDFDNGWAFARELDLPLVDEHYYVSPQWFWDNLDRYDAYDRNGPRVYLGEYAAHEPDRRSTLRSALAEAAALTAMERNGDIVQFASYAPLLARRNHTQWTPDLIYFNGTQVFRTANYFVQQLFGCHGGDVALEIEAQLPPMLAVSAVRDSASGDLILKIVNGAAEVKSLRIELAGLENASLLATQIVLSGPNADAVNEDSQAPDVAPQQSEVTLAPPFDYAAPAHSLTVFRIAS